MKIIVVEDEEQDLAKCGRAVERYRHEKQIHVDLVECRNLDEALSKIDNTFDGAIIDLKLGDEGDEGNQITKRINEGFYRVPVVILTGTPASADPNFNYAGVFTKGNPDAGYEAILDRFWVIYNTGLTRIMGGRGIIETKLGEVFQKNVFPRVDQWVQYSKTDANKAETALLRHTLNHLIQLIDEDVDEYFPEEFYLFPPPADEVRTGSILKEKGSGKRFVVLSPACDLVIRNTGKRKTDAILVVEVEEPTALFAWYDKIPAKCRTPAQNGGLKTAITNNKSNYFHCLPETDLFPLGFMNFRHLSVVSDEELLERFPLPSMAQISPPFVKDMVARFASYYARQGQPDISFETPA